MSDNYVDLEDIQGFLIRGYNFRHIKYVVLNIKNAHGARAFCAGLLPGSGAPLSITNAEAWPGNNKPEYCLNIGFTYYGLEELITKPRCTEVWGKSYELFNLYKNGAADANNCQQIGDTDASAPVNWWLNSGGWLLDTLPDPKGKDLHIQLTLFAKDPADRDFYYEKLLSMIPMADGEPSLIPAFVKDSDPVAEDPDVIHFGYKDSISQPRLDNVPVMSVSETTLPDDRIPVPAYRFIINGTEPVAPVYNAHGLLKNGTFAAFRLLFQDVKKFNTFLTSDPNTPPDLAAAKMCGRWLNGNPLVVSPHSEDPLPGNDNNNFNYIEPSDHQKGPKADDDLGALCPYAAHIRRSNPRDDSSVKGNDSHNMPLQTHRVLRRATPYGPPYVAGEPDGIQRGLIGLFIGAKLTDQFQFIMSQWIESGGFRNPDTSPNHSGIDPLFGQQIRDMDPNHAEFDYRKSDGTYERMTGLTRFIRTDGSMYLFLPGIKGLEWISKGLIPTT
ncbi:MAG: hypothetical protein V4604_12265 [Bacteroidota bacterium]